GAAAAACSSIERVAPGWSRSGAWVGVSRSADDLLGGEAHEDRQHRGTTAGRRYGLPGHDPRVARGVGPPHTRPQPRDPVREASSPLAELTASVHPPPGPTQATVTESVSTSEAPTLLLDRTRYRRHRASRKGGARQRLA